MSSRRLQADEHELQLEPPTKPYGGGPRRWVAADDPLIGTVFGDRFRLEEKLGGGGTGDVYRATHLFVGSDVALKLLRPALQQDREIRERFLREPRKAAAVRHPHIVRVLDAGETDGRAYLAMDYVPSSNLSAVLAREERLSPARTVRLLEQAASALDAAHDHGLVHRDVKPANLLVSPEDSVFVTDFGIAKNTRTHEETQQGAFLGTVAYAAPEQWQGGNLDRRTDVYALGAVLYQCLTGRTPFAGTTDYEMMQAHIEAPRPKVTEARPELPAALDAIVAKALAKDPEERYDSCGELIAAARTALVEANGRLATRTRAVAPLVAAPPEPVPAPEPGAAPAPAEPSEPQRVRLVAVEVPDAGVADDAYPDEEEKRRRRSPGKLVGAALVGLLALLGIAAFALFGGDGDGDRAARQPQAGAGQPDRAAAPATTGAAVPASGRASLRNVRLVAPAVFAGRPHRLTGRLVDGTRPVAGAEVRLEAQPHPFRAAYTTVARARTGSDGSFSFRQSFQRNHKVRVVPIKGGAPSDPLNAYVWPKTTEDGEHLPGDFARLTVFYTGLPSMKLRGTVYFYVTPEDGESGEVRARAQVRRRGPGDYVASVRVPLRKSEVDKGLKWISCRAYTAGSGMGVPGFSCPPTRHFR